MTLVKILLVEDEPSIAQELQDRLGLLGYTILETISSVVSVAERMEAQPADVILLDIHKYSDKEAEIVERLSARFGVPIINLTAHTDPAVAQNQSYFTGPPGHWLKPFHEWELRAAIETALREKMEQRLRESEARNRALLNANPDLMFLLDRNGQYLDVHASDPGMLYMPVEWLLGRNVGDVLPEELACKLINTIRVVLDEGGEQIVEYPLTLHNRQHFFEARMVRCAEHTALSLVRDITERKQAELALQASEAKYRALVENAVDSIYLIDRNYKVLSVNRFGAGLFGRQPEEIVEKAIDELFPKGLAQEYIASLDDVFKTGAPKSQETKLIVDRQEFWISVILSPVRDENDNVTAVIGVSRDITAHKQAEDALRASETRYRKLVNEVNDGFYTSDLRGRLTFVNRALAQMLGYESHQQLLGRRIPEILASVETLGNLKRQYRAALQSGGASVVEAEFIRPDGMRIFLETKPQMIFENGRPVGNQGVVRDISARRLAEAAMQEQADRFNTMLSTIMEGFWLVNDQGRLITVNDAYCRMSGYTRDELLNLSIMDLEAVETEQDVFKRMQAIGEEGWGVFESRHKTKDGRNYHVRVSAAFWQARRQFFVFIQDISQRKRAEEALQLSEQKFRSLMEASPDGIVVTDQAGRMILVNAQIDVLFGYQREELLGQAVEKLLPEQFHAAHFSHRAGYCFEPRARSMGPGLDLMALRKDGSVFPVEISLSPIIVNNETLVIAVVRDIAERRQAEKTLAEKEQLYRALFDLSPSGIILQDTNGSILEVNDSFCKSLGYAAAELIGRNIRMVAAPERVLQVDDDFAALRSGQRLDHVVDDIRKDGARRLMELREALVPLPNGRQGILAVANDITEQRHASIQLEASEKKYRVLLENIPQRVFYKDRAFIYVAVNPSFARDFDMEPDELVGLTDFDIFPLELAKKYRAEDLRIVNTGKMDEFDEAYLKSDGERIVHTVKVPVTNDIGEITGILGIFWDITERKQMEEKLRHLSIHDAQTSLYNRGYFDDALHTLERSRQFPVSIVVADIDGLKEVNDRYGHAAGDKLIQRAAQILVSAFRVEDVVARTGGDEFCILLPQTGAQAAKAVLKRVRRMLREHNALHVDAPLNLSFGLSAAEKRTALLKVLKEADGKMYREKQRHYRDRKQRPPR